MKAIIVDDEPLSHESLTKLLELTHPDVEIIENAYGVEKGVKLIQKLQPELIFLDIEMIDGTGFDLLKAIGKDRHFLVIFITAYEKHAVRAFNFSAIDFVLKPINTRKLASAVAKAKKRIKETFQLNYMEDIKEVMWNIQRRQSTLRLMVRKKDGIDFMPLSDVVRIESVQNRVKIIPLNGDIVHSSKRIGEYETRLTEYRQFIRVHQRHLINIYELIKLEANFANMSDGEKIAVPYKDYLPKLKDRLEEFFD